MKKLTILTAIGILTAAATSMTGCEAAKEAAGEGAKQCGLECPDDGIAEGNANISGVASIDAFFGAVVEYNSTAAVVVDGLTAPMNRIKAQLGLAAEATPAQVVAKIKATYGINGTFKLQYTPPKCQVSAKATLEATAKCDVSVKPGSAKVECSGRCDADVQVKEGKVGCAVDAEMHCTLPSANVQCDEGFKCQGSCDMTAGGTCSGTCNGTCTGECDVKDANGACAGRCDGTCSGKCELTASATCTGKCEGSCSIQAQGGSCRADAKVECYAEPPSVDAKVECSAKCEGEVTPPEASAECEASAKANAELKAECTPPSIDLVLEAEPTINAAGFAVFEGTLKTELAAMIVALKRAEIALRAGANIAASVSDVTASFKGQLEGDVNLKVSIGLGCAIKQLPAVKDSMVTSTENLIVKAQDGGKFVAAFTVGQ